MAHDANVVFEPGLKANVDLSAAANQYKAVEIEAANAVDVVDGAGAHVYGVLYNKPTAGSPAQVAVQGTVKAQAGAAIAVNAMVMAAADGQFVTATATNSVVGIAKSAAGAAGEIFALTLKPGLIV